MSKKSDAHDALKEKRRLQYQERKARKAGQSAPISDPNMRTDTRKERSAPATNQPSVVSGNEIRIPYKSFRIEGKEVVFVL